MARSIGQAFLPSMQVVQSAEDKDAVKSEKVQRFLDAGVSYREHGSIRWAVNAFRSAVKEDATNAFAHAALGMALKDSGDIDGALQELFRASQIDPRYEADHETVLAVAWIFRKMFKQAQDNLEKVIEKHPGYAPAYAYLAVVYYAQGLHQHALELDPENKKLQQIVNGRLRTMTLSVKQELSAKLTEFVRYWSGQKMSMEVFAKKVQDKNILQRTLIDILRTDGRRLEKAVFVEIKDDKLFFLDPSVMYIKNNAPFSNISEIIVHQVMKEGLDPIVLAQDMDQEKYADVLYHLEILKGNGDVSKKYRSDIWEHKNAYDFFYYLMRQKSVTSNKAMLDRINTVLEGFSTAQQTGFLKRQFETDIGRINELWDRLNIFQDGKSPSINVFSGQEADARDFLGFMNNIMGEVQGVRVVLLRSKHDAFNVRLKLRWGTRLKGLRWPEVRRNRILAMRSVLQTIARSLTGFYTDLQSATPLGMMSPQVFVTYAAHGKIKPGERIDLLIAPEGREKVPHAMNKENVIPGAIFKGVEKGKVIYESPYKSGNFNTEFFLTEIEQVSKTIQTFDAAEEFSLPLDIWKEMRPGANLVSVYDGPSNDVVQGKAIRVLGSVLANGKTTMFGSMFGKTSMTVDAFLKDPRKKPGLEIDIYSEGKWRRGLFFVNSVGNTFSYRLQTDSLEAARSLPLNSIKLISFDAAQFKSSVVSKTMAMRLLLWAVLGGSFYGCAPSKIPDLERLEALRVVSGDTAEQLHYKLNKLVQEYARVTAELARIAQRQQENSQEKELKRRIALDLVIGRSKNDANKRLIEINANIQAINAALQKLPGGGKDKAQRPDEKVSDQAIDGGIDLNAGKMSLDVVRDGKGVEMPFDPAMVAEFQKGNFTGVEGIILKIVPIESPLPLLGMEAGPAEKLLAKGQV